MRIYKKKKKTSCNLRLKHVKIKKPNAKNMSMPIHKRQNPHT